MTDDKRQDAKEQASWLAIRKGMSLVRRQNKIIGIKADGSEVEIVESNDESDVWVDALNKLSEQEKITTKYDVIKIFADGGSRGNPGPSASGYVILTTNDEVLEEGGEYLGITTNNQAEYQAVKLALQNAKKYNPKELQINLDSMLVVNQLTGVFKIKNRDLWPIHQDIKNLLLEFKKYSIKHVYRDKNKLADAQVNEVLDSQKH